MSRSQFARVTSSVLLAALVACGSSSRNGAAPKLEATTFVNVPSGESPSLEGRLLLVEFFSPT
jgi:hypothetical protein